MNSKHSFNIKGHKFELSYNNRKTNFWLTWFFRRKSIHEQKVVELLYKEIKPDMCFVDVGAYLGYYTILTSKILTKGEVISFEMDKNSYNVLKENLKINDCNNVTISNKAVTNYIGIANYISKGFLTSSKSRLNKQFNTNQVEEEKTIETTTLDEVFKHDYTKPNIIKIDVEGAEMNVLRGMENILKNNELTLFIEIHPQLMKSYFNSTSKELIRKLLDNGFNIYQIKNLRRLNKKIKLKTIDKNTRINYNSMVYAKK